MSGLEYSGNSRGVCSKVLLRCHSGLEYSGNSIGVCSKVLLRCHSGLEYSGNSRGVCSKVLLDVILAWSIVVIVEVYVVRYY